MICVQKTSSSVYAPHVMWSVVVLPGGQSVQMVRPVSEVYELDGHWRGVFVRGSM